MGRRRRDGTGSVLVWVAMAMAGAGAGVAATLATGNESVRAAGGFVGGVAGLAAGVSMDRARERRAVRAVALRERSQMLDPVISDGRDDRSVFGLLLATRAVTPFRGRTSDRKWLEKWCDNFSAHPVAIVSGPLGVGKTRLVTQFAAERPSSWAVGWLHSGCGGAALLAAVKACGDRALILVDDADERPDLISLLDNLAADRTGLLVRIILVTRAYDIRARIAVELEEQYRFMLDNAPEHFVGPFGSEDDHARWFDEAVRAYARARGTPPPDLPPYVWRERPGDASEPILTLQARALLAVLESEHARPLSGATIALPFVEVAAALFAHEQHRWNKAVAQSEWGVTDLTRAVQNRAVAALLGTSASGEDEAITALRVVPDLADAPAERLANITRWVAHLYPSDPPLPIRMRPDMLAEWFLVTQLTEVPELAHNLGNLGPAQAAALLELLARASDHMAEAGHLFAGLIAANPDDSRGRMAGAGTAAELLNSW
jgi:hypothetical protein